MGKKLYKSKTFWLGTTYAVISFLTMMAKEPWIIDHPQAASVIGIAMGAAVVGLRFLTGEPIVRS